jgi:predicted glycoside hydrolase/deacetylase ChbG (UPF0249 family)
MLQKINRKNLIISADDFGKSELADKNILKLAEAGKLDRISVMIEGDFSKEEIKRLCSSGVKLDIHFELIWQKRRRNLLKDNTLRQGVVFLVNYLWGDWPVPEHPRSGALSVKREWKEQIEKFRKVFGRMPDGMSSHEHAHYFPVYFRIALDLAKKYDINSIRFGKKGFLGKQNSVNLILKNMRWLNKKEFFRSKISSFDYFVSLDWIKDFDEFLKNIPEGEIEISCHPERKEEMEVIDKIF